METSDDRGYSPSRVIGVRLSYHDRNEFRALEFLERMASRGREAREVVTKALNLYEGHLEALDKLPAQQAEVITQLKELQSLVKSLVEAKKQ